VPRDRRRRREGSATCLRGHVRWVMSRRPGRRRVSELHASVAAALARVRLGDEEDVARRTFTVARTEAVLRMREVPRPGPWHWTLGLLRAANAVAAAPRAFATERDEGDERVVVLTLATAG